MRQLRSSCFNRNPCEFSSEPVITQTAEWRTCVSECVSELADARAPLRTFNSECVSELSFVTRLSFLTRLSFSTRL